eukprot:gene2109-2598_t
MNEALIQLNPNLEDGSNKPYTLPEEFFLLLLDPQTLKLPSSTVPLFYGFIGLGITELMIMGKLSVEKTSNGRDVIISVIDRSLTQDPFLNYILDKIGRRPKKSIGNNILNISRGFYSANRRKITNRIGQGLIKKGVLSVRSSKPSIWGTKYYYNINFSIPKEKVEKNCAHICSVDSKDQIPDGYIREIIMILTLRQYTYVCKPPLINNFLKKHFSPSEKEYILNNIKSLEKKYSSQPTTNNDPIHKMIYWIVSGIQAGFDAN